jgi:hypothetical protein
MRLSLCAVAIPALLICNAAAAQIGGLTVTPTPSIGTTSPLDVTSGTSVGGTGIPMGATEINSAGVSPVPLNPTGTIAIPSSGIPCATLGTSTAEMYGSSATYDGGGMAPGASMPATGASAGNSAVSPGMSAGLSATSGMSTTSGMMQSSGMSTSSGLLDTSGMSGMCGSGASSLAASSTPTSTPTTTAGSIRAGVPLGSTEISNLGVGGSANAEHIAHDQPAEFDCAERRHIRFIEHNRNRDDSRSVGKHAHAVRIDFHW